MRDEAALRAAGGPRRRARAAAGRGSNRGGPGAWLPADAPRHPAVDGCSAGALHHARLPRDGAVPVQPGARHNLSRAHSLANVKERPAVVDLDAGAQVERDAGVAGEEPPLARALLDRAHREAPRALEPLPVACAPEQFQERPAVAGSSVAEPGTLPQRPRLPHELAPGEKQRVEPAV